MHFCGQTHSLERMLGAQARREATVEPSRLGEEEESAKAVKRGVGGGIALHPSNAMHVVRRLEAPGASVLEHEWAPEAPEP